MNLKFIILVSVSILFHNLSAQTEPAPPANEPVRDVLDIQLEPMFPGGALGLYHYLAKNVVYPEAAKEAGTEGHVFLSFVVGKDGSITDVKIIGDIGDGCGIAVQRVIQRMPKWSPGMVNGHPVKVRYTLPFCFWLMDNDEDKRPAPPAPLPKYVSHDQIHTSVESATALVFGAKTPIDSTFNFNTSLEKQNALIEMLESAFRVKTTVEDISSLQLVGDLEDYFFKAQHAPIVFFEYGFNGSFAKYLTSRPKFDVKKEGYNKMWSLRVPEGVKMVLYDKQNFGGKSLEINAIDGDIIIPNLSRIVFEEGKISINYKGYVDWSINTKSIKIILPEVFPKAY
ncbi:MAG: energy transducer TonB [Phycisphaerae bacterium]|nr:energy transducer TonB [Saprospiraceae bacterium]